MYRSAYWDGYNKTIKLYTWNAEGERIIVDRDYTPYLYIESLKGEYKSIFGTKLVKKMFKTPWERSNFIKDTGISRVFENFKPAQQFLMDAYEGLNESPTFTKHPLKICFFDIETEPLPRDEFPKPSEAKAAISLITIHNSLDNKYTTFGTRPFTGELPPELNCEYVFCKDEYTLLDYFLDYLEEDHPDVLSAWNSNFFDMEYLVNRITKILGEEHLKRLSPVGKFLESIGRSKDNPPREYKKYIIEGVAIMDYIDVYKKFNPKNQESYRLDHIGKVEVGQQKLEYDGTIGEFQKREWNKFVLYNIRDVELLVRIDEKTNYFGLARYLAYMGLTNIEDALGVVVYSVGALGLLARQQGTKLFTPDRKVTEGKNAGAYVSTNVGLTKDLFTLDFSSLYPNIIISLNISIEKLVGEFLEFPDDDLIILTLANGKQHKLTFKQFDLLIKQKNLIRTAANTLFSQDTPGIVPTYMSKLFAKRKDNRKKLFQNEKILGKVNKILNNTASEEDLDENLVKMSEKELKAYRKQLIFDIKQFDILQLTQKLALNSMYGCLTSKKSPIGDDRLGNSCTLSGQDAIKEVNNFIKDYIKQNYYPEISESDYNSLVQFNDTDSCGVTLRCFDKLGIKICENNKVTAQGMDIINNIADSVNKHIITWTNHHFNTNTCTLDLKLEKICDFGLYRKMKNYVLHVIYDEGKVDEKTGELKVKWSYTGIELAKAVMTQEIKDIGKKVIEPMILKQNKHETDTLLQEAFDEFKELPLTTTCRLSRIKTFNKYVKDCKGFETAKGMQEHIRAAHYHNLVIKNENIEGYQEIMEGDDCQILMVKPNNKYRINCIAFRNGELPKQFLEIFEPDYKNIFKKPFYSCISSLYTAAGWNCIDVTEEYTGSLFDLF